MLHLITQRQMKLLVLFARSRGFSPYSLLDVIAAASCFGLFFGRIQLTEANARDSLVSHHRCSMMDLMDAWFCDDVVLMDFRC